MMNRLKRFLVTLIQIGMVIAFGTIICYIISRFDTFGSIGHFVGVNVFLICFGIGFNYIFETLRDYKEVR